MSQSDTDVLVRPASTADRDAVIALMLAQFREHDISLGDAGVARAVDGVLQRPDWGRLLLATRGGTPVGFAALSFLWTYEHGGRAAWLDELYVVPAQREHGIGQMAPARRLRGRSRKRCSRHGSGGRRRASPC